MICIQIGGIDKFSNTIAEFKRDLNQYGYSGPAVVFLICRVGSDDQAAQSLLQLKQNEAIRDIVLYSEDKLDLKLQEAGNDVNKYAGWVSFDIRQRLGRRIRFELTV